MSRPLGSRYRIGASVGTGGMGEVFLGEDEAGEIYAIKVLRPDLAQDPEVVARFVMERNALLRLRGTHLVPVHDLVIEGDSLALVMEMVPGGDLHHLLFRGPLPPREAARLGAGIARGLTDVHLAGAAHGDLKPKNVLVDYRENPSSPRLTDMAMARLTASGALGLAGSPPYLAPELWQGAAPSAESDLYALGIVLYEMCCGVPPYIGEPAAVREHHLGSAPGRPEGIPDSLWAVIVDLTAHDPARRPGRAAEVAARLEGLALLTASAQAAPGLTTPPPPVPLGASTEPSWADTTVVTPVVAPPVVAPPVVEPPVVTPPVVGPATTGVPAPVAAAPASWPPRRDRRRGALVAGIVALVLLIGAGVWAVTGRDENPTALQSEPPPVVPVVTESPAPSPEATPTPSDSPTGTSTPWPTSVAPPTCLPVRLTPDGGLAETVRRGQDTARCRVDVRMVQTALGVQPTDGYFGPLTEGAVRRHQFARCASYPEPGVIDPWTWDSVIRGRTAACPGSPVSSPPPTSPPPTFSPPPTSPPPTFSPPPTSPPPTSPPPTSPPPTSPPPENPPAETGPEQ